jgi:hypothetical protein
MVYLAKPYSEDFLWGRKQHERLWIHPTRQQLFKIHFFRTLNVYIVPGVADTASFRGSSRRYCRRKSACTSKCQRSPNSLPPNTATYFQPRVMKTAMGESLLYCILRSGTMQSGRHLLLHWQNSSPLQELKSHTK